MAGYTIRAAAKADADEILKIACCCWEIIYDGHAPARRAYQKMGFEVGLPSIAYYKKL